MDSYKRLNEIVQEKKSFDDELGTFIWKGSDMSEDEVERAEEIKRKLVLLDKEQKHHEELNKVVNPAPMQWYPDHKRSDERSDSSIALRSNQSYAERQSNHLPDGISIDEISLTRLVGGYVLGNFKGAEAEFRVMQENPGSSGGFVLPDQFFDHMIDLARNKTRVIQAGALTLPMESPVGTAVKVTQDPTAYWVAEGQEITKSELSFAPIRLKPQAVAVIVTVSRQLIEDSMQAGRPIEDVILDGITSAIALEIDRVALLGTGTNEPRGLLNHDDVNVISMGTNGAALTGYDEFSNAVEDIADNNGAAGAAIMSPRTAGALDRLKDTTNQPLVAPASYSALSKHTTNQVPNNQEHGSATNASTIFVGDFSNMVIAILENMVIDISKDSGDSFEKMQVSIRGYSRVDVAVLRPTHFTLIKGVTP